ncbi:MULTISPECIES: helix-turn-helix domain-containing protein [Actinopolyspora]|uniref:Transcriptional regulator, contains XRE-family HTH domain n=1 Tax=Actinopolyspora saharensis TaxID=995062 RepID=A0A1H1ATZ7_9ACTN|nr:MULTISPECIES: helix-turn-helix transcriptional regulator [Actinopolyspora]NHD17143.1 helix-turn-helix transcriptional regulator [Actinopolyspora sp. BKK2]NHE76295.1 helix-turn-helix transcriptional regulator [Actinopolyspora sp. BKK1]SDQ43208.1 Transcriptional regulator, contains XRE-family HTH domain [Actinopolyspora saharensis]
MTVLLREAVGERLRRARAAQSRTLREVSRAARVSLGYLSEVERGRKEASSELLGSICDALDLPLPELLVTVAGDLDSPETVVAPSVVEQTAPAELEGGRLVPSLIDSELAEAGMVDGEPEGAQVYSESDSESFEEETDQQDRRLQPMLSQRINPPNRTSSGVVVAA